MTREEQQKLIDKVLEETQESLANGDLTVLEEILKFVPTNILVGSLPEEDWDEYRPSPTVYDFSQYESLSKTEECKKTIIDNYIDWYSSFDEEREVLKNGALMYIHEDHVDEVGGYFPEISNNKKNRVNLAIGKDESNECKLWVEHSFDHEDQDKEYPESLVVGLDMGEDGTKTFATFTDTNVREELESFVKDINEDLLKKH